MKCLARTLFAGVAATVMVGAAVPAHAGTFEFIDRMFTFREDQKERVAPKRRLPPKLVYEPYYDEPATSNWSQFYTQPNLEPTEYMNGSASKVMRTRSNPYAAPTNTWQVADPYDRYGIPAQDNEARYGGAAGEIFIGDPGESPGVRAADMGGQVGAGTRIGEPVRDWREAPNRELSSRPGDRGYTMPAPVADGYDGRGRLSANLADQARSEGDFAGRDSLADGARDAPVHGSNDPRYVKHNDKGEVTRYQVQKGDTLSGISGQEAIYNNWKLWPLIYSANRRAIGRDPNNLKNKQELGIPRGYTPQQAREAEKRAGSR